MNVRSAKETDLQRIAEVGVKSFPRRTVQERLERLLNETRYVPSDILVCEEDGDIVGCATLIPQKVWLGGDEYESGGIASVAVEPHCRRRGVAKDIMQGALDHMRSRSVPFSMLHPFRNTFYRNYGYGLVGQSVEFACSPSHIPFFPEARSVRPIKPKDQDDLLKFYDAWLPTQNLRIHRSSRRWEQILFRDNNHLYLFRNSQGRIEGYLCYKYERCADAPASTINVGDFVATSPEAQRALYGFLSAQTDQIASIRIVQPIGTSLPFLLAEPRGARFPWGEVAVGRLHSSFMLKILDPERCFSGKRNFNGHTGALGITITPSTHDVEKEKSFAVEFTDGAASVVKATPAAKSFLKTSTTVFANLVTGVLRTSDACVFGLAEVDRPETAAALDRAFKTAPPYQPDIDYF
ncbi:MAG: GNAT family N-acetyltransferase [bacterium]